MEKLVVPLLAGGQGVAVWDGPQVWVNRSVHASFQGQLAGRYRFSRLAEDVILAGTVISLRPMVAVVALAGEGMLVLLAPTSPPYRRARVPAGRSRVGFSRDRGIPRSCC